MPKESGHVTLVIAAVALGILIASAPLYQASVTHQTKSPSNVEIVNAKQSKNVRLDSTIKPTEFGVGDFASSGEKIKVMKSNLQSYPLPLDVLQIENFDSVVSSTGLGIDGMRKLRQNGFVIVRSNFPNLVEGYSRLRGQRIPLYISSDAIIRLNHIFYNSILAELEEKYLIRSQERILVALALAAESMPAKFPKESQSYGAAKTNLEYLYLASGLQNKNLRDSWDFSDRIEKEYALMQKAEGPEISPIFGYKEDYSQYKPRGHYTSSPELTNYFLAHTWLNRMRFDLTSDAQTSQALLLTHLLKNTKVGEVSAFQTWQSMYAATSFFTGESDDLTFEHYALTMEKVYGPNPSLEQLSSSAKLAIFREELRRMENSKILGTIGSKDNIAGLRFFGQRFAIDSFIHQALSHDKVESRFMVKGLDLPAAFGSSRAEKYLADDFSKYPDYRNRLEGVRVAISEITEPEWNRNLYMSSFDSFRTLLQQPEEGFPSFMRTEAWSDKSLGTFLAGWSLLRHDTISYTKQAYSQIPEPQVIVKEVIKEVPKEVIREVPREKPAEGFVEPQPYLYSKMKIQAEATRNGLKKIGILDQRLDGKLVEFSAMMSELADASIRELKGEELSDIQKILLGSFDQRLSTLTSGLRFAEFIVRARDPDVFTDTKSGLKLAAETGFLDTILVVYETPEGKLLIAGGLTLSYYEFTSEKRLSDEEWTRMLNSGNVPGEPEWVNGYTTSRR